MYYRPKAFFPKKTYSMFGEDLVVKKFFKNKKKGKEGGKYKIK
jgi:hypothetical protein